MTVGNKSPLRYPGGKTRACVQLHEILMQHYKMDEFTILLSPFFGGGSFEFFLQNKYNLQIIANDKFTPLYNFWNTIKSVHKKEKIVVSLYNQLDKITKEIFSQYRSEIICSSQEENNSIQKSVMYFIINRCSFSGATLSGGFSLEASKKRFTRSSIDRIMNLNMEKFEITNLDFKDFFESQTQQTRNKNTLIFIDPPYFLGLHANNLYGNNGDLHENFDHARLYNCIAQLENWILTYNDCEYIRDLYKDFVIVETNWTYGMNKSKKSSEIVITSKKM